MFEKRVNFIPTFTKYYDDKRKKYVIFISQYGTIYCSSEKDRDIIYDFLLDINPEKYWDTNNEVYIKDKKTYTYSLLYNDLEKIKAGLINEKKYNTLNEKEQLILDLPLIMWSKKWKYGSIFMYNWFMEEGDIIMDNTLFAFLDNWKELNEKRNEFYEFIKKYKNKPILKEVKEKTSRLYALDELKKELQKREEKEFLIDRKFNSKYTNFSRFSINIDFFDDINTPYVASFGTLGIGYLLEGKYNREKEEIYITKIWEEINDSFDFIGSQVLGGWNKSIFSYHSKVDKYTFFDERNLNISNSTFNSFRNKAEIGKDFRIKGIRNINDKNPFIKTIKINSNKVIYE
ncbi:hypothetical protein CBG49_14745 [Capnocytophaga endodontalis]|uniref:Uncharacterized protein n=2 Tax=Capnocytophaga endodontalis TaxID=2708117 RepID=A0A1Z4BSQ1_9FLAO|nr:hypothetical protein CBG49_14745 [Capnocytophaga endodontalis]